MTTSTTTTPRLAEAIITSPQGLPTPPLALRPVLRPVAMAHSDAVVWVPAPGATSADVQTWEKWLETEGAETIIIDFEDRLTDLCDLAGADGDSLRELLLEPVHTGGAAYGVLEMGRLAVAISDVEDALESQQLVIHPYTRRPLLQIFGRAFPNRVVYVGPRP